MRRPSANRATTLWGFLSAESLAHLPRWCIQRSAKNRRPGPGPPVSDAQTKHNAVAERNRRVVNLAARGKVKAGLAEAIKAERCAALWLARSC